MFLGFCLAFQILLFLLRIFSLPSCIITPRFKGPLKLLKFRISVGDLGKWRRSRLKRCWPSLAVSAIDFELPVGLVVPESQSAMEIVLRA